MNRKNVFEKAIQLANSDTKVKATSLVRENPAVAAVMSKMITPKETPHYNHEGRRSILTPDVSRFRHTGEITAQAVTDGRTVLKLLPDLELAKNILISSILSPKDMMSNELGFKVRDGLMAPEISAMMINKVSEHFDQVHKIKPLMTKMLEDALFDTGSYGLAVIPENSIDDIINNHEHITMESFKHSSINSNGSLKSIGLLGDASYQESERRGGIAVESLIDKGVRNSVDGRMNLASYTINADIPKPYVSSEDEKAAKDTPPKGEKDFDPFITVIDNIDALKIPVIASRIREDKVKNMLGKMTSPAMENFYNGSKRALHGKDALTDRQLSGLIYKDKQYKYRAFNALKTPEQLSRRSVGNPLVMHIPSEAIIPVFVPGSPEQQVGFFVLIDNDGNPINKANNIDYYQQLSSRMNTNGNFPSAMLTKVRTMMEGFNYNNHNHLDYSIKAYADMIEQDLLMRLRNGAYSNGVSLARNEEIYRVMFARSLAKQHTQLLFIPIELMTYVAFQYNENGIGVSILESMKIINSLRSMVMFANTMGAIKNSIGRTSMKIKLDEEDPDPMKTIEQSSNEIIRSRQQAFPLGVNSPVDQVDFLQRSGYEITHEGHPGMPDISIEFGEHTSNYAKVDTELEDNLRKRSIQATGLPPEVVDAGFNSEFAVSIVTQNILLSKRVLQKQEEFLPFVTAHARKYIVNSEHLLNALAEILENNFDKLKNEKIDHSIPSTALYEVAPNEVKTTEEGSQDVLINQILNDFIMNLEATLPQPNTVTLENQNAALESFVKVLDAAIDAYINTEMFTNDFVGNVANDITVVKAALRAYYIRQWMTENGVLPELAKITAVDENGEPILNIFKIQEEHIRSLVKSTASMMAGLHGTKEASDKVMGDLGAGEESSTPTSSDNGFGGGAGGDNFGFGGGDEGGGFGSDETPAFGEPSEETPEGEESPAGAEENPKEGEKESKEETPKKEEPEESEAPEEKKE